MTLPLSCVLVAAAVFRPDSPVAPPQDSFLVVSVRGKVTATTMPGSKARVVHVGDRFGPGTRMRTGYGSSVKLLVGGCRLVAIEERTSRRLADLETAHDFGVGGEEARVLRALERRIGRAGSARAGVEAGVRAASVFEALFPEGTTLSRRPTFEWVDTDTAGVYECILLREDFSLLGRFVFPGGLYASGRGDSLLDRGKRYHWQVVRLRDGETSNICSFHVLEADTIQAVEAEIEALGRMPGADDTVIGALLKAAVYEGRNLRQEAFHAYREAMQAAPEATVFRAMLIHYLADIRLQWVTPFLIR
ncbi:MAG: hypothetical protein QHI48_02380 [Bacteroidota bacterium]|nr:hypothetical protein [Bacteroidota bacterium]